MQRNDDKSNKFIGYEYKDVVVKREYVSLYTDGYEHFGWQLEGTAHVLHPVGAISLKFKRDRKIEHKSELVRLQREFDSAADEIDILERSKGLVASITAYAIGVIGTVFMGGSIFSIAYGNNIPLMIMLAIPGFTGWIVPYFLYARFRKNKTIKVTPLIDDKYDEIYEITKRANAFAANAA